MCLEVKTKIPVKDIWVESFAFVGRDEKYMATNL